MFGVRCDIHIYHLELYFLETFIIFTFEQFISFRMYVLRVLFNFGGCGGGGGGGGGGGDDDNNDTPCQFFERHTHTHIYI